MSAFPAPFSPDTGPDMRQEQVWLRPGWLRPAALAAGLALNVAAALLIGRARVETPQILPSIDVSLVATPYVPPPAAAPEPVPPEPAPLAAPEPEITPPPAVVEPPVAEPPVAMAPPAPPPAVDPAIERRKAEEAEKLRQERARELREAKKQQEVIERQAQARLEARREAQEKAKDAAKARQAAANKGVQEQRQNAQGESRAAYGGVVVAEIQRRRPIGAARAGGATGQVGVTFTVGASGRIVSHRLDSSPDPRLTAAVGAIMAAVHAPPPPGGSFTAHTSLNFSAK